MPLTFDLENRIINIPKSYMILVQSVPSEIYQLDLNALRLDLKNFEDSVDGMPYPDTHAHNTTITVSGAVLARVIQFINNWTITFEDGQYRVNAVGANSNIGEVVNVNQVSVSTSNSAGLQDLGSLQAASFGGGVAIDPTSEFSGTIFPVGTRAFPCNNTTDTLAIAKGRGLKTIFVAAPLILESEDFAEGYVFRGDNPLSSTIHINTDATVSSCEFVNLTISGIIDNNNLIRQCSILDITHVNGFLFQCALSGTMILGGELQATILDCYSGIAGGGENQYPIIDMGGGTQMIAMRGYSGGIGITNCTGILKSSIDMNSGRVVFENTVSGGDFTVRGVAEVINNSTGSAIIKDDTTGVTVEQIWTEDLTVYPDGTAAKTVSDTLKNAKNSFAISAAGA